MLKLLANMVKKDGMPGQLAVMGLSEENLKRLKERQPIVFNGRVFGLPEIEFLIFAGTDEASMFQEFRELVGPNTKVSIGPKVDLSP